MIFLECDMLSRCLLIKFSEKRLQELVQEYMIKCESVTDVCK